MSRRAPSEQKGRASSRGSLAVGSVGSEAKAITCSQHMLDTHTLWFHQLIPSRFIKSCNGQIGKMITCFVELYQV